MRDFYQEDDSDRDLEGFYADDGDDADMIGMAHVDLINTNLHHQILTSAIDFVSRDWLWKFRSQESRSRKIANAYRLFNKLIEEAKG